MEKSIREQIMLQGGGSFWEIDELLDLYTSRDVCHIAKVYYNNIYRLNQKILEVGCGLGQLAVFH